MGPQGTNLPETLGQPLQPSLPWLLCISVHAMSPIRNFWAFHPPYQLFPFLPHHLAHMVLCPEPPDRAALSYFACPSPLMLNGLWGSACTNGHLWPSTSSLQGMPSSSSWPQPRAWIRILIHTYFCTNYYLNRGMLILITESMGG